MSGAPIIADLSDPPPEDPREQIAFGDRVSDAQRGFDIHELAPLSWTVCKLCDRPCVPIGQRSLCCRAPIRMQGWAGIRPPCEGQS